MKKKLFLLLFICTSLSVTSQTKILFDATKAEMAGNADWVIDADLHNISFSSTTGLPYTSSATNKESNPQRIPTPAQSGITTSTQESYWQGALSNWAVDCVKQGYQVETLPYDGVISYGNSSNTQDLSNYKIFVVVEPNIKFTASEKTAILNFVQNGGSLFMVSDHITSDRNNDGFDSPQIWDDLIHNNGIKDNPFGIVFDSVNISGNSSTISTFANDSLLHNTTNGYGNVTQVLWTNGTTITINPTINPTVRAAVFKSGSSTSGKTNILVAYARYGLGKVVAFGDSSPFDDGTGDPNDQLYGGYITDAAGNHEKIIMNATIWLATTTVTPVSLTNYHLQLINNKQIANFWTTATEINTTHFNIQRSVDGTSFETVGTIAAKGLGVYSFINPLPITDLRLTLYYRLEIVDKDGSKTYSTIQQITINPQTSNIVVYPNPAKDIVNVETNNIKQIQVIDCLGKVVVDNKINNKTTTINVCDFYKGIYFIRAITNENNILINRFIKE